MNIESAFSIILTVAGSALSLGLIGKAFTNVIASVVIKRYELVTLKTLEKEKKENQKEIEELKLKLTKLEKEHDISFSNIYKKREEIITNLYILMTEYLEHCTVEFNPNQREETREKYKEMTQFYLKNRLYFSTESSIKVFEALVNGGKIIDAKNKDEFSEHLKIFNDQVLSEIPNLFKSLLMIE